MMTGACSAARVESTRFNRMKGKGSNGRRTSTQVLIAIQTSRIPPKIMMKVQLPPNLATRSAMRSPKVIAASYSCCTSLLTRPRRAICVTTACSISEIFAYSFSRYPRNFLARNCSWQLGQMPRFASHSGRSFLMMSRIRFSSFWGEMSLRPSTGASHNEQLNLGMGATLRGELEVAQLYGPPPVRSSSQQRAAQHQRGDGEVDDDAGHVYQRRHERRRRAGGVEAQPAQQERQHRSGERAEGHDAHEGGPDRGGDEHVVDAVVVPAQGLPGEDPRHADRPEDDAQGDARGELPHCHPPPVAQRDFAQRHRPDDQGGG